MRCMCTTASTLWLTRTWCTQRLGGKAGGDGEDEEEEKEDDDAAPIRPATKNAFSAFALLGICKKCFALLGTNGSAKAQKVLWPCQMYKNAVSGNSKKYAFIALALLCINRRVCVRERE